MSGSQAKSPPRPAPELRSSWKLQDLGRMGALDKGEPETLSQIPLGLLWVSGAGVEDKDTGISSEATVERTQSCECMFPVHTRAPVPVAVFFLRVSMDTSVCIFACGASAGGFQAV